MHENYSNRTYAKKKTRGRPTAAEIEQRPQPQPAQIDPTTDRYICQHCGKPTLIVYKTAGDVRYLRCSTGCGARFAKTGNQLQRIKAPPETGAEAA